MRKIGFGCECVDFFAAGKSVRHRTDGISRLSFKRHSRNHFTGFPPFVFSSQQQAAPPRRERIVNMNIYVGNMPYAMTAEELKALFAAYGDVADARLVIDRDTGRVKGFGFVEMNNKAEAEAAIQALNGTEQGGRTLVVNEARPREPRRGGFGGHGAPRS